MPASCEACGKEDLLPENYEAWGFYQDWPGLIRQGMDGTWVDYTSALSIIDEEAYPEPTMMLRKLEAIRQGLCQRTRSK
ncbi:MAG: hypothetical protein ACOY3Z_00870 [Thermodesulfobacteriota bacterium]